MKPKICLVCDIPNWAFDIISKKLQKALQEFFEIDIAYFDLREEEDNFFEFIEEHKHYDLLHFFWRKTLMLMESEAFVHKAVEKYKDYETYIYDISQRISTSVNDFMFLSIEEIETYKNIFNKYSKNYFVICKPLLQEYLKIPEYKKPWGVVHDMYDSTIMKPMNIDRFDKKDRPLIIGWVGNSKFSYGIDLKGFNTIIKPTIEELKEEGYQIEEYYADRNIKWRTHDEMPEYYSNIDVCLCTSITEGTPLPILECMSCGVPVITTDVGVVREALGIKQQQFILGNRNPENSDENIKTALKKDLIQIYENRELLKELSEENLESIELYDGGKIINEFKAYFENCLK